MAKSTNPRKPSSPTRCSSSRSQKNSKQLPPSCKVMKNILTCKHLQVEQPPQHSNSNSKKKHQKLNKNEDKNNNGKKMRCTGSSHCSNTKVMQRPTIIPDASPPELLFYRRKSCTGSSLCSNTKCGLTY